MSENNKAFVIKAITEVFIDRDPSAIDRYWSKEYLQHNPSVGSGNDGLKNLVAHLGSDFKYEIGMATADGDLVMVHGRYTGFGPTPIIAVDIFRIKDGLIAEHWDVLQEEVSETVSGLPMFEPTV